jgi:hypothetical protein
MNHLADNVPTWEALRSLLDDYATPECKLTTLVMYKGYTSQGGDGPQTDEDVPALWVEMSREGYQPVEDALNLVDKSPRAKTSDNPKDYEKKKIKVCCFLEAINYLHILYRAQSNDRHPNVEAKDKRSTEIIQTLETELDARQSVGLWCPPITGNKRPWEPCRVVYIYSPLNTVIGGGSLLVFPDTLPLERVKEFAAKANESFWQAQKKESQGAVLERCRNMYARAAPLKRKPQKPSQAASKPSKATTKPRQAAEAPAKPAEPTKGPEAEDDWVKLDPFKEVNELLG